MVLERVITIREAIKNPWWMIVVGGFVSLLSLIVSFIVFPSSIGLFTTFLITFTMTPFMVNLISYEEAKEEEEIKKKAGLNFLQRHYDTLIIYSSFFAGVILTLSIIFVFLPTDMVEKIFEDQINQIKLIRANILFVDTFEKILINNVGVLMISFVFALLFGAGAIFILSWNASVLATAIGLTAKSMGGLTALPAAFSLYIPHGSLEILAYFIGGIAGGIASAVISKRKSQMFGVIMKDSLFLLFFAIMVLVGAAIVETSSISFAEQV